MKLTLGLSSCPNDTFIFDALIHQKIDTEGLEFRPFFSDVEQLNRLAFDLELDVTKLSFHAFLECVSDYALLDSGAALGRGCGPLLVKKKETILTPESLIAIPGKYTTANLLMSFFNSSYINKKEILFSDIEDKIISDQVDAGVIIHENRFTYSEKGLNKVDDLGELWEKETGCPIPLGGIVIKRHLPFSIQQKVDRVLRRSIEFALNDRASSLEFVRHHAQEIKEDVIEKHIELYVNEYTLSLSEDGRRAVKLLFQKAGKENNNIFIDSNFRKLAK